MSSANIGIYGEELYEQVLPLHGPDPDGLLHDLIGAYVHGALEIDDLARDDAQGRPGWGVILDVDECPAKGLPWLSQVAGVQLRDPKIIPFPTLPNPQGQLETGETSGWSGTTTVSSGTATVSTATNVGGAGFDSRHTGTGGGVWTAMRSTGIASLIPAVAGTYYGLSIQFHTESPLTGLGALTLSARWLDASLALISETAIQTSISTLEAFGPVDSQLFGTAQSPAGTAYVGLALSIPVASGTGARHFYSGDFVISPVDGPDSTIPAFGDPIPAPRLETDDEWAVYARDAIKRQGGKGRGTTDAILSAAEDTLIGTRSGRIVERVGGNAYALELITRPSETPDPDATLAAAMTQKPTGMSLIHTLTEGAVIDEGTVSIDTATGQIDTATIDDLT